MSSLLQVRDSFATVFESILKQCKVEANTEIELEAKVGLIIDNITGQRPILPVLTECIINNDNREFRFESNIKIQDHKKMNQFLNEQVSKKLLQYKSHIKTIDSFSIDPKSANPKIRITKKIPEMTISSAIAKERLFDFLIYFPDAPYDLKVSFSDEKSYPYEKLPTLLPTADYARIKNRICYQETDGFIQYDLTQVSDKDGNFSSHEFEIEILPKQNVSLTKFSQSIRNVIYTFKNFYR